MALTSWIESLRARCIGCANSSRPVWRDAPRRDSRRGASCHTQAAEQLEDRTLLSVSALLINGTLNVTASGADNITVRANSTTGKVEVLGNNNVLVGSTPSVNASALTGLVVAGSDSSNVIDLSGVTAAQFTTLVSIKVNAGDGNDRVTGSPNIANSLNGGDGADTLTGGSSGDMLNGGNGADAITGGLGNDSLLGGDGADTLSGDAGLDTLEGGNGADLLSAGDDNDSVNGGNGADNIDGGLGNDTLNGDGGSDTISGGDGNDVILGGEFNDSITGDAGNDTIDAQAGDDTVGGGTGDDSLLGGSGNDSLLGNVGNDTLNGEGGNDSLSGDLGNDLLLGGSGNDSMDCGDGNDTGLGQAGNDTLIGSGGADSIDGGAGNDLIRSEQAQAIPPPTLSINDVTINENTGTFTAFSTNFDNGVPTEISGATTLVPVQGYAGRGTGSNVFAGNLLHNNTGVSPAVPQTPTTLTLTNLPTHTSIDLNFLFRLLHFSWPRPPRFLGVVGFFETLVLRGPRLKPVAGR